MKSVVINYKDAVGVGNLSAAFWTLHGSVENANKEVSKNEEKKKSCHGYLYTQVWSSCP